jgi:hypothetical protein
MTQPPRLRMRCSYTYTATYVFTAWSLVEHRDNSMYVNLKYFEIYSYMCTSAMSLETSGV